MQTNAENIKGRTGITHRVFWSFFALSIATLVYVNLTDVENLRLVAEQFPEVNISLREAFVNGYKIVVSVMLFLLDIILVGPFAYLSYFGDHISPKKDWFVNSVSFFDIGLLLATVFTFALIALNFTLVNSVDANPIKFISPAALWYIVGGAFLIWIFVTVLKTYSYSSDQRNDLKKYIIRF